MSKDNDNDNKQSAIHIVGAGGAGFWFTLGFVRSVDDPARIHVYDTDDLRGGLGHARLPVASPTTKKVDLLRGAIRTWMGDRPPQMHDALFTGDEPAAGDLVVDCSDMRTGDADDPKSRAAMWERVKSHGARIVRVSYDGAEGTVVVVEGLPFKTEGQDAGYAAVPSLALSLMAGGMGAEVVKRMLDGPTEYVSMQVSVADFVKAAKPAAKEAAA